MSNGAPRTHGQDDDDEAGELVEQSIPCKPQAVAKLSYSEAVGSVDVAQLPVTRLVSGCKFVSRPPLTALFCVLCFSPIIAQKHGFLDRQYASTSSSRP